MRKASTPIRRLQRRWIWLLAMAVLGLLGAADHLGLLLVPRTDDFATYHGRRARVLRVVDGDTVDVDIPDGRHDRPATRVRLIGLDCPERARGDQPAEPLADEAASFVRSKTEKGQVTLLLEPHRTRGVFGRVLARVELPDGGSLNESLLRAGLARADDRWPHSLLARYARVERTARRRGTGLWALRDESAKTAR